MQHKESQEQMALFSWAEHLKVKFPQLEMLFAIPNSGGYSGGFKSNLLRVLKMKREGVKPGVPDIFLAYPRQGSQWPNEKGSHGLFIEMKSEKGKCSTHQTEWINALRKNGYEAEVCHSWTQAVKVIGKYLEIEEMGL